MTAFLRLKALRLKAPVTSKTGYNRGFFKRTKTPRYAGSSKKAKPLNKLKRGLLCEISSCPDYKLPHKGDQQ